MTMKNRPMTLQGLLDLTPLHVPTECYQLQVVPVTQADLRGSPIQSWGLGLPPISKMLRQFREVAKCANGGPTLLSTVAYLASFSDADILSAGHHRSRELTNLSAAEPGQSSASVK